MDQREAYAAGGFWGDSGGFANTFLLIPAFVDPATRAPYSRKAGPVCITDYGIVQQPGGTGICIALFDTDAVPANGRDMFSATPGDANPKRIIPVTGGNGYIVSLPAPWHRFDTGFVAVVSTSYTTITYGSATTFFSVRYTQVKIGGYAAPTIGL